MSEQVDTLFMQAPVSNITAILIGLLYFTALKNYLDPVLLSYWILFLSATALHRIWLWWEYKNKPDVCETSTWLKKYTLSSTLIGVAWSAIYIFAGSPETLVIGAFIVLYFGVTVAAFSILAIYLPAYFLYTIPATIAFLFTLNGFSGQAYTALQIAIAIFYIMMGVFVVNTNRNLLETITLRNKNQNLVDELTREVHLRDNLVTKKTEMLVSLNDALFQSENQLRNVINAANLGYWDWDYRSGRHEVNERWLDMLGLNRTDIKNDVSDWSNFIHPDDHERVLELVGEHIKNRTAYTTDFRMKHKDGHWVWIQGSGAVVEYCEATSDPIRLCGTHEDISIRKELEHKLEFQATHDELTGLLNRVELWKQLDSEIRRAERYKHDLSIFLIDIDHFKSINDQFGHKVGDKVLQKFTKVLLSQVRITDYATRYGGEEFVVILPETGHDHALELADRLRSVVDLMKIPVESAVISTSVSIGVSSFPGHGETSASLLDAADKAMYQAKEAGRNLVQSAI